MLLPVSLLSVRRCAAAPPGSRLHITHSSPRFASTTLAVNLETESTFISWSSLMSLPVLRQPNSCFRDVRTDPETDFHHNRLAPLLQGFLSPTRSICVIVFQYFQFNHVCHLASGSPSPSFLIGALDKQLHFSAASF